MLAWNFLKFPRRTECDRSSAAIRSEIFCSVFILPCSFWFVLSESSSAFVLSGIFLDATREFSSAFTLLSSFMCEFLIAFMSWSSFVLILFIFWSISFSVSRVTVPGALAVWPLGGKLGASVGLPRSSSSYTKRSSVLNKIHHTCIHIKCVNRP